MYVCMYVCIYNIIIDTLYIARFVLFFFFFFFIFFYLKIYKIGKNVERVVCEISIPIELPDINSKLSLRFIASVNSKLKYDENVV